MTLSASKRLPEGLALAHNMSVRAIGSRPGQLETSTFWAQSSMIQGPNYTVEDWEELRIQLWR